MFLFTGDASKLKGGGEESLWLTKGNNKFYPRIGGRAASTTQGCHSIEKKMHPPVKL